jgi:hypothetical protein
MRMPDNEVEGLDLFKKARLNQVAEKTMHSLILKQKQKVNIISYK